MRRELLTAAKSLELFSSDFHVESVVFASSSPAPTQTNPTFTVLVHFIAYATDNTIISVVFLPLNIYNFAQYNNNLNHDL